MSRRKKKKPVPSKKKKKNRRKNVSLGKRKDRNDKGGGIMLLVKKCLESAPVLRLNNASESIWCKIKIQGKFHFISSWYRPPNVPHDTILLLKEQIDKIMN